MTTIAAGASDSVTLAQGSTLKTTGTGTAVLGPGPQANQQIGLQGSNTIGPYQWDQVISISATTQIDYTVAVNQAGIPAARIATDASGNVTGLVGPDGNNYGGIVLQAKMTGGANDAAAVNAAINTVSAAGGGVVEIPAGNWWAGGILMKSNVWLRAKGRGVTTLKLPNASHTATSVPANTTNIIFAQAAAGDLYNWKITGLSLDGNRTNQTEPNGYDNGLNCICVRGSGDANSYYCHSFVIEDIEVKSAIWHGIALYDGVRDFTINRVHGYDNGYRMIHCHSSDGSNGQTTGQKANSRFRVMNCTSHANGVSVGANMQNAGYMNSGIFVVLNNAFEAIVTGNNVYDEVGPGIDIAGIDNAGSLVAAQFHIISHNTITNCGDGIALVHNPDCLIISDNIIRNCTKVGRPAGSGASGYGIVFRTAGTMGGSNIKVHGNIIYGCYGWGIATTNATNKWKHLTISNNHVINNSTGSTSGTSYGGIFIQAADGCIVTGNVVKYNANAGAADRQIYTTTVTNTIISNNVFDCQYKYDGATLYGNYPAAELASSGSGLVFSSNYCYRSGGTSNGYNFAAANSVHFNNAGDRANSGSFGATGSGPRFNHDITNGAGSAALGANCPATTPTAPFAWTKVTTMDGSTGYVPVWK